MTQEPDEALLWARENVATWMESNRRRPLDISAVRDGKGWVNLQERVLRLAEGYRAGQAAAGARLKELEGVLRQADELFRVALPKFNWGASSLDAETILILNQTPGIVRRTLLKGGDA